MDEGFGPLRATSGRIAGALARASPHFDQPGAYCPCPASWACRKKRPMSATPYPCPCCGHLVFADPPGSSDICMICFWEDDATQLRYPDLADETNVMSLTEA